MRIHRKSKRLRTYVTFLIWFKMQSVLPSPSVFYHSTVVEYEVISTSSSSSEHSFSSSGKWEWSDTSSLGDDCSGKWDGWEWSDDCSTAVFFPGGSLVPPGGLLVLPGGCAPTPIGGVGVCPPFWAHGFTRRLDWGLQRIAFAQWRATLHLEFRKWMEHEFATVAP